MVPAGRKIRRAIIHAPSVPRVFERMPSGNYWVYEHDGKTHEGFPTQWVFEESFYGFLEKARNCGWKYELWYEKGI